MNTKITPDHLRRAAVVYVRQSTMTQVTGNLESQRRQYDLAGAAATTGFASVTVIDDDLGRSGSGSMERPGFERLVAQVCSGDVGAVYCIEASRLARNGRDWHHLIDLCALAGTLVIDPDGAYDPRLVNDRLLLGLKGTMSEYELGLMRQRGIAARDSKAGRGELRFMLPPGLCWSEVGKIEIDPDEHVAETIRLVFAKFRELGSGRQVFLWLRSADIKMPVVLRNVDVCKLVWKAPAYHSVMQILHNPLYAGAYAFGRRAQRTRIIDGRARKATGVRKPRDEWSVLLRDNHQGYISWREYEENHKLLAENAHMKKNCDRKSARGGRALLTGLMRCGRCGRMMRVFYGSAKGNAHRYQCRGDDAHVGVGLCIGIGGVRVDRAVAMQILEAVSDRAVEAAIFASDQIERSRRDVLAAIERDLEGARYEALLASRRYELVDPAKRHVARELEARWNDALERVGVLERKIKDLSALSAARPVIDRGRLLQLAQDLPTVWNAPSTETRTKQRLIHILVQEIICDLDDATNEAVLLIHWTGGRHTEVRVARVKTGRYPAELAPSAVEALRKLGGHWPDRELAVSLNRMLCKTGDGESWTTVRVRDMRERLGIPEYDATKVDIPMISLMKAAEKLGICVGSAKSLVQRGILPATQILPGSPWMVPVEALSSEAVRIGVQGVIDRRPKFYEDYQYDKIVRLPGI
ncbi:MULTISPECIES: recombinase family protein [Agrobacterium tumefaciens complex]|uniref:DNA invertase Pin-like site-specific DNA recombinase n=1 Tax=Agrobacterium radiobacter TaxID=362 RepID=A0ABR6J9D5_AGRRD|nr:MULTISPECIES: recombinase family protein [Agrobacterium tumefaciens complex]TGE78501.1 serine recombinase [Rhizobium sp. SEMIA 439]MBB4284091.1 DNA invertase Pin-like site-specific DNA recombinase [Agrobacterium radiobacter]MBB4319635.1 DNA invertase Pin-like site-specific DNA recombinase [Agrobacterium radiobacter]MBB4326171.1 DNA invertase Pin-like site-specific DNA recombinase [Agrobacterium radiobacter]MBB4338056.1 DNA invertase Pin-like site-specific DNA recombinase [Agrobacterium radi